jgi:two-component system LytT family response regulator
LGSISKTQLQLASMVNNRQLPDTIALPTNDGLIFTAVNDIVHCVADGNYTRIHFTDKKEMLLSKTLGDVDELLSNYNFFRIHHSSLINLKQVKKYIRGEGGEVIMSNGHCLAVARTRKTDFLNVFTHF